MATTTQATKPRSGRASTCPDGEPVPVIKGSHVYLIDGSGYIFRAFHALPPLTRPSDGLPVGAVHGFCSMLWKLLGDSKLSDRPTHIAVIFDAGRASFRNTIYEAYKANRPPPPDELAPQFPLIRDAVKAFNIACIELEGYEADDIIATYARQAVETDGDVTIVSSDKDLMQLVRSGIVMLDPVKNRKIGREEVEQRFGVPPDQVIDVQALAGDSTDNVPGVPGIGVKTAAELIKDYGSLDALLERAGEIKQPKRRERLLEFAEQARVSRELVRLKDDTPVDFAIDCLGVQDPDPQVLFAFLRKMEFSALTRRIAEALKVEPPAMPEKPAAAPPSPRPAEPPTRTGKPRAPAGLGTPAASVEHSARAATTPPIDRARYFTLTALEELEAWIARAYDVGRIAVDTETTAIDPMRADLVGFSISTAPGEAAYVPLAHKAAAEQLDFAKGTEVKQMPMRPALDLLKPLLEDPAVLKIGHNTKFDIQIFGRYGIRVAPIDDTLLISYALEGGKGNLGLDDLAERQLGHTTITFDQVIMHAPGARKADKTFAGVPVEKATEYAAEDAEVALRLWMKLRPRLVAERVARVYETLERPLVPVIADMERAGIKVDRAILSRLTSQFAQTITRLENEVADLVGHHFNLGSPKQLGELLFDRLKLPGGRRTKSGQWETRASLLDDMAANEELDADARKLINVMLEWRQLAKLTSTYTDALPAFINAETSRIHTCYSLGATTTGRLASTEPNLQNIPIRTKEGRQIRTAFIADNGHKLISADYSQIELRVLAHVAEIPQLRQAFADGLDIHAMTASEMFNTPIKDMPAEVRRRAKAINFGIIYGISAFGLANQLGISREEAGEYIQTYFKRFPGIRDYMERTKKFAREHGYVETIFGRRAHYPEINTKNPSVRGNLERAAINAPIQGSAADIIRRAMIRMPASLQKAGLSARMLLQVHDELLFEAREAEVKKTITTVCTVMEKAAEPAVQLRVPLHVDAKAAGNWDEAH